MLRVLLGALNIYLAKFKLFCLAGSNKRLRSLSIRFRIYADHRVSRYSALKLRQPVGSVIIILVYRLIISRSAEALEIAKEALVHGDVAHEKHWLEGGESKS